MSEPAKANSEGRHQNDQDAAMAVPLVSVCMLAYNVEPFVAQAIEGVLHQQVDFPIELVIGNDGSTDRTPAICEQYQQLNPKIIRVLAANQNLGIAGNAVRTLSQCRGKYIAICDGDDIWIDPEKLRKQVEFLEQNSDYGMSYSDIKIIAATGEPAVFPEHEENRSLYAQGNIFIRLLHGNFICNSTAVFRRHLLDGYEIDTDRNYYIHDFLMWLHITMRSKAHFLPSASTAYRKHAGGVTNTNDKARQNSLKFHLGLFHILIEFDQLNTQPLNHYEKTFIFRKLLSLLYRKPGSWKQKFRILLLLPKYFPGLSGLWIISRTTPQMLLPQLYNENLLSNL